MQTKMDLHSKKIKSIMEELAKVQSPAPKGKSMYELHCHTTASDGKLTPIELIDVAEKLNIKTIAITDHNTVNGSLEAQDYIKRTGKNIEIINAVEIDACEFKMFHFLAYGIKDMPKMKAFLDDLENKNQAVLAQIIDKLKNQGVDISVDGVRKLAGREKFKKTNIIDYLIENGYAKDWQDVQDRFLGEKCVGYIKRVKPSAQEVIDIIHGCGGVCVLAHPMELSQMNKGSLPNIKTIEKLILVLLMGLFKRKVMIIMQSQIKNLEV